MQGSVSANAGSDYEAQCEQIFAAWLGGRLPASGLSPGLSVQHCPEPYLDFADSDRNAVWVTHNPGRGEDFQLRSAVDTAASPISSRLSYAENSRRLAEWYAGHGRMKISAAARSRIAAMLRLGNDLGFPGVRQIELFPLHSEKSPPDEFLFGQPNLAPPLRSYGERARALVAASSLVVGLCGSAPNASGMAVRSWSRALLLDLRTAQRVPLSVGRDTPTVGMFVGRSGSRVSVLFCRQGSNGLPARDMMPSVVAAIQSAMG